MKKYLVLAIAIMILGCKKNDEFKIKHRTITGTYRLISVVKAERITDEHGTRDTGGEITTECDKRTIIDIRSDGTVEQTEFSGVDCGTRIIHSGTWKVTGTFFGSFNGELKFSDSTITYEIYELEQVDETITELEIAYGEVSGDPPERYIYTYVRSN